MFKPEIDTDGLIICPCCKKPVKTLNTNHLKKCSGLTHGQFHEKYQTETYLLNLKAQFLNNYYVLNRHRFLQYYYHSLEGKLKPRTIKVGDGLDYDRKYILNDGEIKKHLKGDILLGVYFHSKVTKVLCFDLDTKEISLLSFIVNVLYELGFEKSNIVTSFSGNKGYHIDVLFEEPIFRNIAQSIYDHVQKRTNISKMECRGGVDDRGYKLPLGTTFINGKNVYCYLCTEEGEEVPYELELEHIKSKKGISEPALAKICKDANIIYKRYRKFSEREKKDLKIKRDLQRAAKITESASALKRVRKRNAEGHTLSKKNERANQNGNLTYTYRENAIARCQDYIKLIYLRNQDCEGFRNETLFEYAVSFKGQLTTQERILAEIKRVNQLFRKPLQEDELADIAKSAMKMNQFKTETILRKLNITRAEQQQLQVIRTEDIRMERKNKERQQKRAIEKEHREEKQRQEIIRRLKERKTPTQIAAELEIDRATVYRRIKRLGIERRELLIEPKNATQTIAAQCSLVKRPLSGSLLCRFRKISADPQANCRNTLAPNHNSGPPGSIIDTA